MKKLFSKFKFILLLVLSMLVMLCGCTPENQNSGEENPSTDESEIEDNNNVDDIEVDTTTHSYTLSSSANGVYTFTCQDSGDSTQIQLTATCSKGTECISVTDNKITFGEIEADTTYALSGTFYGSIEINAGDDYEFKLSLNGLNLTSYSAVPILVNSCDKATITGAENTANFIYDLREEVDDEGISASIYSYSDLDVQGKGSLTIKSENNNGIHTKDNLTIKNITLLVDSVDNALKGNDGVTIESGTINLISRKGDGIKTTNSHVSSKGNQKGDVIIKSGSILIYSACDGIDSAHDTIINQDKGNTSVQIFTDKYSKYSEEVTATSEEVLYVRYSSSTYKYSIEYSNSSNTVWQNSSTYETKNSMGRNTYYYPITKPAGYTKVRLFIYSSDQTQGQSTDCVAYTDYMTLNSSYDTISLSNQRGQLSVGWTNYSTSNVGGTGGMGGMGGMEEGNTDKGDYSTKGIKADNEISILSGTITISAYDDAIHTNNDVQLGEEGAYYYGSGDIEISGGTITIHSNDDGIHADGTLTISGGEIKVTNSYEGLEGSQICITGGNTSIKSSDDGLNSTIETGTGITISGGTLYVNASGDGLDSNTQTAYGGLNISGGKTVVISNGPSDSALDSERGYTFTGGYVVAIGRSGSMSGESKNCASFDSVGTYKTMSLSINNYLTVENMVTVKMPTSVSALVVVLGNSQANISSSSSAVSGLDTNGVIWYV